MNQARLVQSLGWLAFLALLILTGSFSSYIATWQSGVLFAAVALFALLVLCDALFNRAGADAHHGHDHGHDHDHDHAAAAERPWLSTAMHLLPLFLFLAVGTTTLGSQAVSSLAHPLPGTARGMVAATNDDRPAASQATAASGASTTPAEPAAAPSGASATTADPSGIANRPAEDAALAAPDTATASPVATAATDAPMPLNLLDLYYPAQHVGVTRVQVVGRVMLPTKEDLKHLPPDVDPKDLKLLIYRYMVTCCAADAQPVIVILKDHPVTGLKADDWVNVTGRWLPPKGLGDMTAMTVDKLEPVAAPKDPYLHPVWR